MSGSGPAHAASCAAVGAWNADPCPTHSALLAELGVDGPESIAQ